ncbi:ABC transporter permease [Arcanobacterium hippocoleae]
MRHRVRSILTAISLLLGIVALTSVASAQEVINETITRKAILTGGPSITSTVQFSLSSNREENANFWVSKVHSRYGNEARTSLVFKPSEMRLFSNNIAQPTVEVIFVEPSITRIRPFKVLSGAWFESNRSYLAPRIVLNSVAANLFHSSDTQWKFGWGSQGEISNAVVQGIVDDGEINAIAYVDCNQDGKWNFFQITIFSRCLCVFREFQLKILKWG